MWLTWRRAKKTTCTKHVPKFDSPDYRVHNYMGWFGSFNEVRYHKLVVVVMLASPYKHVNGGLASRRRRQSLPQPLRAALLHRWWRQPEPRPAGNPRHQPALPAVRWGGRPARAPTCGLCCRLLPATGCHRVMSHKLATRFRPRERGRSFGRTA